MSAADIYVYSGFYFVYLLFYFIFKWRIWFYSVFQNRIKSLWCVFILDVNLTQYVTKHKWYTITPFVIDMILE